MVTPTVVTPTVVTLTATTPTVATESDSYEVYYTYNGEIIEGPEQRPSPSSSVGTLFAWLVPLLGLAAAGVCVKRNPAALPALRAMIDTSAPPPSTRRPSKKYAQSEDELERAVGEAELTGVTNNSGAEKGTARQA